MSEASVLKNFLQLQQEKRLHKWTVLWHEETWLCQDIPFFCLEKSRCREQKTMNRTLSVNSYTHTLLSMRLLLLLFAVYLRESRKWCLHRIPEKGTDVTHHFQSLELFVLFVASLSVWSFSEVPLTFLCFSGIRNPWDAGDTLFKVIIIICVPWRRSISILIHC